MKREVSKRRQPLVRTAVYSFMTLCVVAIVTLLMFIVLGYSFNEHDGKIEQGGLLQFASTPTGADVTLDEMELGPATNSKATVSAGSHSVSYDRDGYRSWKKTISIEPGQIGWLSYARLIPKNIAPTSLRTFPVLTNALASPQYKYMVLHEAADKPSFVLANIEGDTVRYEELVLPAESYTVPAVGKSQSFTAELWSRDENAVLVKHTYNDNQVEWLLLNRDSPERSVNISASFGITPVKLQFAGTGSRLLFVQTDDVVRRINLDDQTLSRPLATKVAHFTGYDDKTIVYASTADDKNLRHIGYAATDINVPVVLATYPNDGQPLYADMSNYFSKKYLATVHGTQMTVTAGSLPTLTDKGSMKSFAKQTIPAGTTDVAMSRNHRFAVAQLPDGYATYDIELKKYDRTTWATQPTIQRPLEWLDDYMFWSDAGGILRFYEFDGANQQNIMPVTEGFSAGVSSNDKYVYGVLKTDKGFEFKRARLILE
jgi:hypothetical protein